MRGQQPTTQSMTITNVKNHLSDPIDEIQQKKTRVLVENAGRPVAALVSPAELERLERLTGSGKSSSR